MLASCRRFCAAIVLVCAMLTCGRAHAYSVLSHEEIVDMAWPRQIVPLLRAKFPQITDDQLREAHAYAYGGSVIQDIGYYPFGSHFFSDLLHYVRPGDFVEALLRDADTADEYAFALGALAHYCGDTVGHPYINRLTAAENPDLRQRYGRTVTYDNDPLAHVRTEFGFDVVEVAHGAYSQENYRDFIGFRVAKPVLERAFRETYGIPMNSVIVNEDLAIATYRSAVATLIPKMTKVAWVSYHKQIEYARPGYQRDKFLFRLRRTDFNRTYGRQYKKPGFSTHLLAFFIRLLPKTGALRSLQVKIPDSGEQTFYMKSMNESVDNFYMYLHRIRGPVAEPARGLPEDGNGDGFALPPPPVFLVPELPALDLDTGRPIASGEYPLADQTYAKLLALIETSQKVVVTAGLRASILDFYALPTGPDALQADPKEWVGVQTDLAKLRAMALPTPLPAPSSTLPAGASPETPLPVSAPAALAGQP
jgi:hypothetical protein